jgi:hypothetical protein
MTMTDHDMREQVKAALDGREDAYDVEAIVSEIQETYGTTDIETLPGEHFWTLVERHER